MSRGKYTAKAAKKRAEDAADTVTSLRQTLEAERAAWKQERSDLLNEVQRLRNKLLSDIEQAAAEHIRAVATEHAEALAQVKKSHFDRASRCLALLGELHPDLPMKTFLDTSDALGVNYSEAVPDWGGVASHRRARRATNSRLSSALRSMNSAKRSL